MSQFLFDLDPLNSLSRDDQREMFKHVRSWLCHARAFAVCVCVIFGEVFLVVRWQERRLNNRMHSKLVKFCLCDLNRKYKLKTKLTGSPKLAVSVSHFSKA